MYGNICTIFGCHQVWNRIHQNGSISKLLIICALSIMSNNNDLLQGGKAKKVAIIRYGAMIEVKKDRYCCVYRDNVTHQYAHSADNQLQVDGREYFENWEINGSKSSNDKGKGSMHRQSG